MNRSPVLLVHGLGRTPLSLLRLAHALAGAGHRPTMVGYLAGLERFTRIRDRVRRRLEQLASQGLPYAAVGHSLGGLLLRAALAGWPPRLVPPRHLILLGTPHRPPLLATRFRRLWLYRLALGQCGQLLAQPEFFAALPPLKVPCTVVAGTRGWPLWSGPFAGAVNDGIVALSEVRPPAPGTLVELPVGHTFMMNDRRVRDLLLDILAETQG
jgi:hypothetical protein